MQEQTITVTNKNQLLVAFGCALDFAAVTRITLIRKTGKTFYKLAWASHIQDYNKNIRKARTILRKIPAKHFK